MGFFDGLKKVAQGKPVFEVSQEYKDMEKEWSDKQVAEPVLVKQGPKVIPEVIVNEYHTHLNGSNMDCEFVLQNKSDQLIEIDKVLMFGNQREINDHLRPRQERSFTVYAGPRPKNSHYDDLKIQYKNETGDYFMSTHHLEFQKQADGTYIISRVRFIPPVRDI